MLFMNTERVEKIAVNSIELSSLITPDNSGEQTEGEDSGTSSSAGYNWASIVKAYNARDADLLDDVNLYMFVAKHYKKNKLVAPQFFGFYNKPTWPLDETYSMWMLTLYKPWQNSLDSLKEGDSFVTALLDYMWDPAFPKKIAVQIHRKKEGCEFDSSEGDAMAPDAGANAENSHSSEQAYAPNEEAANAADEAFAAGEFDDEHDADFTDEDFTGLFDGGPFYDWSEGVYIALLFVSF
jgi:hypothetical protein